MHKKTKERNAKIIRAYYDAPATFRDWANQQGYTYSHILLAFESEGLKVPRKVTTKRTPRKNSRALEVLSHLLQGKTQTETGKLCNCSRQYVEQIARQAERVGINLNKE